MSIINIATQNTLALLKLIFSLTWFSCYLVVVSLGETVNVPLVHINNGKCNTTFILINNKHLLDLSHYEASNRINDPYMQLTNIPTNLTLTIASYSQVKVAHSITIMLCNMIEFNQSNIHTVTKPPYQPEFTLHFIKDLVSLDSHQPKHNWNDENINIVRLTEPILSTYYSVWQTQEAQAWQNITYNMKIMDRDHDLVNVSAPTMEQVIRTADNITIYDLVKKWSNITNSTKNSLLRPVNISNNNVKRYYQETPLKFGFYCLYENDENEYLIPNCTNVSQIVEYHANLLQSSGFDFIVLDLTNGDESKDQNIQTYINQIRPTQVLYQKWYQLNQRLMNQTSTNCTTKYNNILPKISVWNPTHGTQYKYYLDLYNKYSDIVYQYQNNKLIYFVNINHNFPLNKTIYNAIENNNGKNNIQIQKMWYAINDTEYDKGLWTYVGSCRTKIFNLFNISNTSLEWIDTSAIHQLDRCNLLMTAKNGSQNNLGSQMALSLNAIGYKSVSLPFASPSKLNGRTFQLMVKDILINKPENVLIPSFNELECQAHSIALNSWQGNANNTWSVGLLNDKQNRDIYFLDTYGSEINRAYEPTVESGDFYFKLVQSCLRVIRLSYYFNSKHYHGNKINVVNINIEDVNTNTNTNTIENNTICNIQNEICCNQMTQFNFVWSLYKNHSGNQEYFATNNQSQKDYFVNKLNFSEVCVPFNIGNPTGVFCVNQDPNYLNQYLKFKGSFILLRDSLTMESIGSLAYINIEKIAIYRCKDNVSQLYFIANDNKCNNVVSNYGVESLVGYAAVTPSSAMARVLFRCKVVSDNQLLYYYHSVGNFCLEKDLQSQVLGYVI